MRLGCEFTRHNLTKSIFNACIVDGMSARKCRIITAPVGTAEWVIQHSAFAKSRGKNLSATFLGILEPRKALAAARQRVRNFGLVEEKGVKLSRVHKDLASVLLNFLEAEPDFYAFLDYVSGKFLIDGWRPGIDTEDMFCWVRADGRMKLPNGDLLETPSMQLFLGRLKRFTDKPPRTATVY